MADGTLIEWTDATWNVVNGCSLASPGCTNCYAMLLAGTRLSSHPSRIGLTQMTKAGPVWTGETRFNEKVLLDPLRWQRPRRIFVCAHGDLFHESVPDDVIDRVFAVMGSAERHQFQVLTKRSARMRAYLVARKAAAPLMVALGDGTLAQHPFHRELMPPKNIWLGVSVEDQARADERIPDLLETPAAVRWLSCEPLLGRVDLTRVAPGQRLSGAVSREHVIHALRGGVWDQLLRVADTEGPRVDWVVVGGESGPKARPMHHTWARSLRDQCANAGVPFLFKQWGEWAPIYALSEGLIESLYVPRPASRPEGYDRCKVEQLVMHNDGEVFRLDQWSAQIGEGSRLTFQQGFDGMTMFAVGKKRAGRALDGALHDGYPG